MAITPLPPAPLVTDDTATFNTKAFAWVDAIDTFTTEANSTATQVNTDAGTATTQAGIATTKAGEASTSADLAEDWATKTDGEVAGGEFSAKKYAQDSSTSADEAAASALEAASLVENYQGALTSDPSLNKDGGALAAGDWYVNTSTGFIRAYTGSEWVTSVSVTAGVESLNGLTGSLTGFVTETGSQTLTNKIIDGNLNTITNVTPDEILQPTNVSPANAATDIGDAFTGYVTLTGSAFRPLYSGTAMAASQWQISTVSDFSTTVVDTSDVAGTAVTYTTDVALATNTLHYWRVRYKDENGVYSEWSEATSFTTASAYLPSIGEAISGGYFAGVIVEGGDEYAIIVSPKASGENSSKQYKTTSDAAPVATQTLNNGPAASASMNSSAYPAAQFCEGLTIGGFSDWYLPARDELELCYRNLKPTTGANNTSNRATSAYTYPEGNDLSADTMGVNRNSSPTGVAYTSGDPGQTSVTAFQTGNSEAFAFFRYWSSSEFSSSRAWTHGFADGGQPNRDKGENNYVRAVRRVAI